MSTSPLHGEPGREAPAPHPPDRRLAFGSSAVVLTGPYAVAVLPDGKEVWSAEEDTDAYRETAARLGYGTDTSRMMREHYAAHIAVCAFLGLPESPTLRNVAEGLGASPITDYEEAAVLGLQAFSRAAGVDLLEALARFSALLERE